MPLYLTEEDVEAVFEIGDALEAVEGSFRRQAAGEIENRPRDRLRLEGGQLAVMAAVDLGPRRGGREDVRRGARRSEVRRSRCSMRSGTTCSP